MNIVEKRITEIHPYEKNAKRHDERQVKAVAKSIQEFGFVQPIVVDKNGTIVIGHCRYEAAKSIGLEKVPCVTAEELTQEEIDALRLVDNKTNESHWDFEILGAEIGDIPDVDFTEYNFGDFELLMLQNDFEDDYEIPDTEPTKAEVKTSGRIIIITHGETEEQFVKELFGVTELKPSMRVADMMKQEEKPDED